MSIVLRPGMVILRFCIEDNRVGLDNPVDGELVYTGIRRISDGKWWNWTSGSWATTSKPFGLTGFYMKLLDDQHDGSYEFEWDQVSADGGADAEYAVHYIVGSPGRYLDRRGHDHLVIQRGAPVDAIAFTFTVNDGSDAVSGATVHVRLSAAGRDSRRQVTGSSGKAIAALSPGTYYVQASKAGYTHTEETVVVSESSTSKTLTMASVIS